MTDRYARQEILPEVGAQGQARLGAATVLVVGAGGLGCAVLSYLAAAGVGTLIIVDHDRVEESNLHRQPLYRMSDLGQPKVQAARAALTALNPATRIEAVFERLTSVNGPRLVAAASLVIDAADSFAVTYLLSDVCHRAVKPLISASVLGLAGYVGAFCGGAPSYRAVFPELPRQAGSCAESGVLGTAVGVIGTLQAHMALALLLDWQPPVLGRMLSMDLRTLHVGGFSFAGAGEPAGPMIPFIAAAEVERSDVVIDLRSLTETPVSPFESALRIEVEALEKAQLQIPSRARVVLCCRSGVRAWRAAQALRRRGHEKLALIAMGE
ncbi:MAG: HesA/MoeB/ThiF family protein [Gammaproteobacteria bacterium]|nr:HesA/MoeB/ThiF family protein [Gammaproteobacteria bacterium]MBV8306043.1 HesA/MoeB/ThiF family protein [Gammaproteobacteria bacterium]MBV8403096.1 HesA/MoeB/ThiF family protein [Gammaproteobacteria bacterium]